MSQENVEIVRRGFEMGNRDGIKGIINEMPEEVEQPLETAFERLRGRGVQGQGG
jgi:PleD family two-component response regulator